MTRDETIELARTAKELKESYAFKTVIAQIDREVFEAFKNTTLADQDRVRNLHSVGQSLNLLSKYIEKYIGEGALEQDQNPDE